MADILQIGISGLRASQSALTVTGHNITNANTEGYSRQVLSQSTTSPQAQGGVWVGTGVSVDAVSRIYDKFLTEQLWRDSSTFNKFETLANNAEQINSLLADANTGIQPGLEKMFGALQTVADSPASLAARAVLLSESQGLVDRFHLISDRLSSQNTVVNGQLKVIAGEITEKAKAIAQLNEQIAFASASAQGNKPNDLLDRRDQLVKDLSELVDLKVVEQDDGIWNITIGNGQPLVVGIESRTLKAASGSSDATRLDLFFETERGDQQVTGSISGGKLGGILDFRNQVLEPTYNELGRLALVINQTFNEQHKLGIDYDGRQGVDYFTDINEPVKTYGRVLSDGGNKQPQDRVVSVYINDASVLTTSDYRVEFPGPDDFSYRIVRASDNQLMLTSSLDGVFPNSIEVDGFEIRFEAGTFQSGDKFLITPTRNGAAELELNITRGEQIAMASPIKSDATLGNRGNAKITQPTVYNSGTQFFSEQGELKPPLIVVFTSPTTYDVLDNSDPGRPVPLFPPITNQNFVPGVSNSILPAATGKTALNSYGGVLPRQALYQAPAPAPVLQTGNGFAAERLTINRVDPVTGKVTSQPVVDIKANTSAKDIAAELNKRQGIQASARTTVELSNFTQDSSDSFVPMAFTINGVNLSEVLGSNQTKYEKSYPAEVPDPITPNFLADRINSNYEFQKLGIIAKSDGETLTIIALNGDDLNIEMTGDQGDQVMLGNGQQIALNETGNAPFVPLTQYDGYDFTQGGPYSYEFDVPGQGSFSIVLDQKYATGDDVIAGITKQLEQSGLDFTGSLDVKISERGVISFQPKIPLAGTGVHGSSKVTMGGQLKVVMDEGYSLNVEPPGNNLFPTDGKAEPIDFGFEVKIDGVPQTGDTFTIGENLDGKSDNRNGVMLAALQSASTLNGNASYTDSYSTMVERVGSITSRAQINRDSTEILLQHSENAVTNLSGVNLDEEAAALIRYELAYNASAQIIQVARSIFDTLISTFR